MTPEATFADKALLDLAYHYREEFRKTDGGVFLAILGRDSVVTSLFCEIYKVLLKFDGIVAIEELPVEDKRKWYNDARLYFSGQEPEDRQEYKDRLRRISTALYTLFTLTEME